MMGTEGDLELLASSYGVMTRYFDVAGVERFASAEALLEVLTRLGAEIHRPTDLADAVRARRRQLNTRIAQPVVVAWDAAPPRISLRVPKRFLDSNLVLEIGCEDGAESREIIRLRDHGVEEINEVDGDSYATVVVTVTASLPFGRHRLAMDVAGLRQEGWLIAAPRRCWTWPGRHWGVFAPVYGLRRGDRQGGTLTELGQLVRWTSAQGGKLVATLPLGAAFLDEPFEPSPYMPVSRLFWNDVFLDLERLPEGEPEAIHHRCAMVSHDRECGDGLFDYRRRALEVRRVAGAAAERVFSDPASAELAAFVARHPRVTDYARFRAVHETRREPWPTWPARLRDGTIRDDDFDPLAYRYHFYVQWRLREQLEQMRREADDCGARIYLDLPLGVHGDGYDSWRERDSFIDKTAAGAPPDTFFTAGQNWGFSPPHPERIRETGYRYFVDSLRAQMSVAGILRLDHVMGLHRLFVVPGGMSAREGVYLRYPAEELYAVLALESTRHRCMVVGEDLGTVPPEVPIALADHSVQRMWVMQYEISPTDRPLSPIGRDVVASLNTHDMPPLAAFWLGDDIDLRVDLGLIDDSDRVTELRKRELIRGSVVAFLRREGMLAADASLQEVMRAVLEYVAGSEARIVLLNLEDLWLERAPQNVPGTGNERSNWQRLLEFDLERLTTLESVLSVVRAIHRRRCEVTA